MYMYIKRFIALHDLVILILNYMHAFCHFISTRVFYLICVLHIIIVVVDQIVTMPRCRTGESDQLEKNKSLYKDMFRDMHYFQVQLRRKYAKHIMS